MTILACVEIAPSTTTTIMQNNQFSTAGKEILATDIPNYTTGNSSNQEYAKSGHTVVKDSVTGDRSPKFRKLHKDTIDSVNLIPAHEIVGQYVELTARGDYYGGNCPDCEGKNKFNVTTKGQIKCHKCSVTYNPVSFVMKMEGLKYYPAIELIAQQHNIQVKHEEPKAIKSPQKSVAKKLPELSLGDRHQHYSQLISSLKLSEGDRELIRKRGLTDAEIDLERFKSVERYQTLPDSYPQELHGVKGKQLGSTAKGILIPISQYGQVAWFHLHNPNPGTKKDGSEEPKYNALYDNSEADFHLGGEQPMQLLRHSTSSRLILIESVDYKAIVTHYRLGVNVAGSPGMGVMAKSPNQLRAFIDDINPEYVEIPIDAGVVASKEGYLAYSNAAKEIESWGYKVKFLWWNQAQKSDLDIDELVVEIGYERFNEIAKLIDLTEFVALCREYGGLVEDVIQVDRSEPIPEDQPKLTPAQINEKYQSLLKYQLRDENGKIVRIEDISHELEIVKFYQELENSTKGNFGQKIKRDFGISLGDLKTADAKPREKDPLPSELAYPILSSQNLAFNEMTLEVEKDGDRYDLGQVYLDLQLDHQIPISKDTAKDLTVKIAKESSYHPVKRYLDSLPKSSDTSILDNLASRYLGTSDPFYDELFKLHLVASVARIYEPGCKVDTMLILQGLQGYLKTTYLQILYGKEFFEEGFHLSKDKDDQLKLRASWALEFGEFETVWGAKGVSEMKAFLSCSVDRLRVPYGTAIDYFPRTSVFVGTTNQDDFLKDPTGERRYWVLPVLQRIPIEQLKKERDQIWAAAIALYKSGHVWYLDENQSRELESRNNSYKRVDEWQTIIAQKLGDDTETDILTVMTVYLQLDVKDLTKANQMRVGEVLRALGWSKSKKNGKRGWTRPPLSGSPVGSPAPNPNEINASDHLDHLDHLNEKVVTEKKDTTSFDASDTPHILKESGKCLKGGQGSPVEKTEPQNPNTVTVPATRPPTSTPQKGGLGSPVGSPAPSSIEPPAKSPRHAWKIGDLVEYCPPTFEKPVQYRISELDATGLVSTIARNGNETFLDRKKNEYLNLAPILQEVV